MSIQIPLRSIRIPTPTKFGGFQRDLHLTLQSQILPMPTDTKPAPRQSIRHTPAFRKLKIATAFLFVFIMIADLVGTIIFYNNPLWVIDEVLHLRLRMAGIDSKFTTVGPYRVHYFVGGEGPPVLLIHGLGSRSEDWTPEMPDYVSSGYRVYAVDLLGCGRTDHPDLNYTIQQQVDFVQGFLAAMHVEKADVIGWSMGGWIALEFAQEHPENVRRVVAMDGAGLSFQSALTPQVFEPHTIPQLKQLEALLDPHPFPLPAFFNRALLDAMQRNFAVVHRTVASMIAGKDNLDDRLSQIKAPVLLVWGEDDTLIPPSVAFRMHQSMPQSVLQLYRGCGHIGPATCSSTIVPHVIDFLHSEPATAGGVFHY